MIGGFRIALLVAAAIAAAVAANFVLIGVATGQHDPVGQLSPRVSPVRSVTPRSRTAPPSTPARHRTEGVQDD